MRINQVIPPFSTRAIVNKSIVTLSNIDFIGHYSLFFFYAMDFSFVCPSEIHALQDNLAEFKKRDVKVVGISVDSVYTHMAWVETPREKGGVKGISFPLLSDSTQEMSSQFGVLDQSEGISLRASFIADPEGIIQYASVNTIAIGRSIKELLRVTDAIQFSKEHGQVCPANWKPGSKALKEIPTEFEEYFASLNK